NSLRRGMKHNSFEVLYQPILDAGTGKTAVEALIRLKHPEIGLVGPNAFLAHAEKSGFLFDMDLRTLRKACLQVQTIPDWSHRITKLAVNCEATALRRIDFPDHVEIILRESGFPADRIEFELNEKISMYDVDTILPQIQRLRKLGVSFALDDFGQGYSALGLLLKLPVQKVKLDRMFVQSMNDDPRSYEITKGFIQMCDQLQLPLVAEGVETQEQLEALHALGCRWMQGYRIGR